jgi:hypothetical protein
VVQWVTPTRIYRFGAGSHRTAVFTTLEVRLVPEPARFALLSCGALLVAALGARRRRRR